MWGYVMDTKRFTLFSVVGYAISGIWHLLDDIFIEPLAFAFAVLLVLTRFQIGIEQSENLQEFSVWLGGDMLDHPLTYIVFGVLFVIWVIFKIIRIHSESNDRQQLSKDIRELIDEIRKERDERNN